jgi:hypothetical protein
VIQRCTEATIHVALHRDATPAAREPVGDATETEQAAWQAGYDARENLTLTVRLHPDDLRAIVATIFAGFSVSGTSFTDLVSDADGLLNELAKAKP